VGGPVLGGAGSVPGAPWPGPPPGVAPGVVCDGLPGFAGFAEGEFVPEALLPEFVFPELPPDGEAPKEELAPLEAGAVPEEFCARKIPAEKAHTTKIAIVCRRKFMRVRGKFLRAFQQRAEQCGGII
jgi:hypothetical protein